MQELSQLIEKFDRNLKQYKSSSYDEANVRVDFIDKFFTLLSWDVSNEKGYSEDYREVVREDKVIIQGKPKAPDYSFRIGGTRKFFVEAKKPSMDIKQAKSPAFQIRRYAYTAKLPLSILTDFEEFAVYDTRIKPDQRDDASVGRVFYCKFTDYEKEWKYLIGTFSPDSILTGSFDKYISDKKRQKGTSEVDKEFLNTIDGWRVDLAKDIAKSNKNLETYDINYAVQKIIDRIIFLRFAEDKNIEEYGNLKKFLEAENKVYPQLDEFFKKADSKYNSSLFKPEAYISDLDIEDKTLHSIIRGLYYPKCPYEFSVLPIEILGSIYEKFLGKTIRLTASHQAKIEEKPEVRKAGGVYYTPQYIVDYIVENTMGEKLKSKKPTDTLTILDPACGSGSFLVRAYDYLLKWYLKQYTKGQGINKNIKDGKIYQVGDATYRLSIKTKQEILKRHIYGVDIDRQAVEVTKLSLLLKLMEGESEQTSAGFLRFDQAQLLPDLSENIKCGNSLIGSDFYQGKNLSLFGTGEKMKINVFDWESPEGFGEIMKRGGFDCVIGNPPYGYLFEDKNIFNYISYKYYTAEYKIDSYTVFLERGVQKLQKDGFLGFIVPYTFMSGQYFSKTRLYLKKLFLKKIVIVGKKVFHKASVDTTIIITQNTDRKDLLHVADLRDMENLLSLTNIKYTSLNKDNAFSDSERKLLLSDEKTLSIYSRINEDKIRLSEVLDFYHGLQTRGDKKAIVYHRENSSLDIYPLIKGRDFQRYQIRPEKKFIIYKKENIKSGGNLKYHLVKEKIVIRTTGDHLIATIDYSKYICLNSINIALATNLYKLPFVLGIINSTLSKFWYDMTVQEKGKTFAEVKITYLKKLPIPKLDLSNPAQKSQHDKMVSLVEQMLAIQKKLYETVSPIEKKQLSQEADILDKQIDVLVYELYELTPEEIKIVEGET